MTTVDAIKQLFVSAGASWILWLLGALSVASVAVFVERWRYLRSREGNVSELAGVLDTHLRAGRRTEATQALLASPAVSAQIAAAGIRLSHLGAGAAEKAMQSAMAQERGRLESRLAFLGTLGNNAPFVGLFGTVIGVIQAFEELGHAAPGHGQEQASAAAQALPGAASQVASQAVMSAIAEALVATAVGIAVALPAVAAYNYLQRKVTALLESSDVLSNLLLAYLAAPADANTSQPTAATETE